MARIIDNENHNSYYDGVVLVNCTYVNCDEGTTGTITNCNYAEIGRNNTVTITGSNYIEIGDNNSDITISDSDYIIIGVRNRGVNVGIQQNTDRFNTSGADSVTVVKQTIGLDITGNYARVNKTRYGAISGCFSRVDNCGSIVLDNANGNELECSRTVDLKDTNNDYIFADNIQLWDKQPFLNYSTLDNVVKVEPVVRPIERQSDSVGTILDTETNTLNGRTGKSSDATYTLVGGIWTIIQ